MVKQTICDNYVENDQMAAVDCVIMFGEPKT